MNNFAYYITGWGACTLAAIVFLVRNIASRNLLKPYLCFLAQPWRAITFLAAALGITLAAPYTGDHTWDYFDGAAISFLTYLTAPWSVGILYRVFKLKLNPGEIFIACALMLFSSSWFYDGYILLRDGVYPATWLSNLIISPCFYIAGGLFWNLEQNKEKGSFFSFQRRRWFLSRRPSDWVGLIWIMMPFMCFGLYGVLWFLWNFHFDQ